MNVERTEPIESCSCNHECVTFAFVDRLPIFSSKYITGDEHSQPSDTYRDALLVILPELIVGEEELTMPTKSCVQ